VLSPPPNSTAGSGGMNVVTVVVAAIVGAGGAGIVVAIYAVCTRRNKRKNRRNRRRYSSEDGDDDDSVDDEHRHKRRTGGPVVPTEVQPSSRPRPAGAHADRIEAIVLASDSSDSACSETETRGDATDVSACQCAVLLLLVSFFCWPFHVVVQILQTCAAVPNVRDRKPVIVVSWSVDGRKLSGSLLADGEFTFVVSNRWDSKVSDWFPVLICSVMIPKCLCCPGRGISHGPFTIRSRACFTLGQGAFSFSVRRHLELQPMRVRPFVL
jgi:hypothetical protein